MRTAGMVLTCALMAACLPLTCAPEGKELAPNGGFEEGFKEWTVWGENAKLITLETTATHSGKNSAQVRHGHNALYFTIPLPPGKAYELRFWYRLSGSNPAGQLALGYYTKGGAFRSAGHEICEVPQHPGTDPAQWTEYRKTFMPSPSTASCQVAFSAAKGSAIQVDDVSLREVPRPAGLKEPPDPWGGMKHTTKQPLFKELLTKEPGNYTMVSWAHDLSRDDKRSSRPKEMQDDATWEKTVRAIYHEAAEAGMGFMDLPGRLDSKESWRTAQFHRDLFDRYNVRYDVWSEGSPSIAAAIKNGAEVTNPSGKALGRRATVSWVDPKYVEAQAEILRKLGTQLKGEPFVGYYYGKDEPTIHIPEGRPETWGEYGRAMAKEVREKYGFGKFEVPQPDTPEFEKDPQQPLRWIAYNRWANDRFVETRCKLRDALREADPDARYSPADFWFMTGFGPYDFTRMAACADLMELDPYGSSAERRRGRGVYNHGFGAKFMTDLTDKPVRIIAQAFDYAGYDMTPENLREWVSQAMRCGASAIDYYTMDSPRWTHPDRWKMMLHLSKIITRMNRIDLPPDPDTAILYALYTHMSHGHSTGGDQVYAAHALVGELAGSWFRFVSDAQLERNEQWLDNYKAVYLPLARYMTPEAAAKIEDYVRSGGTLVCGDADAFSSDLAGNDTSATQARILGIEPTGSADADRLILKVNLWDLEPGTTLPLFSMKAWDETTSPGMARAVRVVDKDAEVLGTYPDGSPAIVRHQLGKGTVIAFAANPFAPLVTVEKSSWPKLIKALQKSLGCKVERPIWRFALPPPGRI